MRATKDHMRTSHEFGACDAVDVVAGLAPDHRGKVRDVFRKGDELLLVATGFAVSESAGELATAVKLNRLPSPTDLFGMKASIGGVFELKRKFAELLLLLLKTSSKLRSLSAKSESMRFRAASGTSGKLSGC